jgi:hypothetical protein
MDHDSSNRSVVAALRVAGIDVVTAAEANRERCGDEDQLSYAAAERRAIVTANRADFARLHGRWMAEGRTHAGIIVRSRQWMSVGHQIRALIRLCAAFDEDASENLFEYLEAWTPPAQ